jgi:hypothetical protein
VSLGPLGSATTAAGGHFAFDGVPAGSQAISLDLTTVPALFDSPADAVRAVEVSGNAASNVAFGLVPLGAVRFGTHAVTQLAGSLPEGAELTGPATVEVVMTREVREPRFEFFVKLEMRPDVRKVFPPKRPQTPAPARAAERGVRSPSQAEATSR